ncbi:MAG: ZIP family zinc transporter [Actinomycetota bacterium]|nr:ZIP family zinc transporter [Actinomycetota bacterium]
MLEAALWGLVGASSLLIGAVIGVKAQRLTESAIGMIMAFGAGTLISALAFELTEEAYRLGGADVVAIGLAAGGLAYFGGSVVIKRRHRAGGRRRSGGDDDDSGSALLLGAVLDGIPESAVIGLSLIGGGSVGVPILAAVFLSNMPEAISSSREMREHGMTTWHVLSVWAVVCLVSALAAGAGYALLEGASDDGVGLLQAFAGGAVLTMLADTMIPDAYNFQPESSPLARSAVGLFTVLGFALAYLLSTLE